MYVKGLSCFCGGSSSGFEVLRIKVALELGQSGKDYRRGCETLLGT